MSLTKMQALAQLGQSLWIDNISRSMIASGQLKALIDQGLRGQTSNPTIFKQAISTSNDYDQRISELIALDQTTFEIYDDLTIKDVQSAADLFLGVYTATKGLDGYVSLEINPMLANEMDAQLKEGLRLWKKLNRPNVMIKVPATKNGCLVVEGLIAQGVNVNVTLIFSAEQYAQVVWSYFKGLKRLAEQGGDLSKVHSVASVFVSRLDAAIDPKCEGALSSLRGVAAVANCEIIFHKFLNSIVTDEFKALQIKGANVQRVLWASTGTKDPKYSDIKYVTQLMASPTVNTLPDKTLDAYLDHGVAKLALPGDVASSQRKIEQLRQAGIDPNVICLTLLQEGLSSFEKSFEDLLGSIEAKSRRLTTTRQVQKNRSNKEERLMEKKLLVLIAGVVLSASVVFAAVKEEPVVPAVEGAEYAEEVLMDDESMMANEEMMGNEEMMNEEMMNEEDVSVAEELPMDEVAPVAK